MPPALALLVTAAVVVALALVVAARCRRPPERVIELTVAAAPEDALLASAAALRRMGLRITRYDAESGTLEARASADEPAGLWRVWARSNTTDLTRLRVETAQARAGARLRRFRAEIAAPEERAT
jgi:hypothetical protein